MYKEEFLQEIIDIMPQYLFNYDIEKITAQTVQKNNGVSMTGMMILLKGESVAPNIYMDYYYAMYEDGYSLDEIAAKIVEEYESAYKKMPAKNQGEFELMNMKDNVYMVLVNYEKNKEKLEECPYIPFLDLAVMFRYVVCEEEGYFSSGVVRKTEQDMWNITTEELYKKATENTKKMFPGAITKLTDKLSELDDSYADLPETNLYILSNTINSNGAVYMTDKDCLESFASQFDDNFFIIPSSIHEVLLMPEKCAICKDQIKEIVSDVNHFVLSEMEYLSDNVYYYNRDKKIIEF